MVYDWNDWRKKEAKKEVLKNKYIECNAYIFPALLNELLTEGYAITCKINPKNEIHYMIKIN